MPSAFEGPLSTPARAFTGQLRKVQMEVSGVSGRAGKLALQAGWLHSLNTFNQPEQAGIWLHLAARGGMFGS